MVIMQHATISWFHLLLLIKIFEYFIAYSLSYSSITSSICVTYIVPLQITAKYLYYLLKFYIKELLTIIIAVTK